MHIYLQNRCTNFSKQRIQKKLYALGKRKGQFHFGGKGYHVHFARQYILQLDQYACNTIFLLNPTRIIIVHFVIWFISNMFLFFYSCYCMSYNSTLESFLDEIFFLCHAKVWCDVDYRSHLALFCFLKAMCKTILWHPMPNCNVTLIGNP